MDGDLLEQFPSVSRHPRRIASFHHDIDRASSSSATRVCRVPCTCQRNKYGEFDHDNQEKERKWQSLHLEKIPAQEGEPTSPSLVRCDLNVHYHAGSRDSEPTMAKTFQPPTGRQQSLDPHKHLRRC